MVHGHAGTHELSTNLSANLLDLLTGSSKSEAVQLQHLVVSLAAEGAWTAGLKVC